MLPNILKKQMQQELDNIKTSGLYRKVNSLTFIDSTHAVDSQGKKLLIMASNNYLGLTFHPTVIDTVRNALTKGTGSTGSRLTTGGVSDLSLLESRLAEFKHTQDALFYNTGYMTNLGVISSLADKNSIIFSDELNHASIIDGIKLSKAQVSIYKHSDIQDLTNKLTKHQNFPGKKFIITDGVFSMDGDIAKLPEIVNLCKHHNACLIVDDAHAVGVLGTTGAGTAEYFGLQDKIPVQTGTFSKALGGEGGYVVGDNLLIEYLRNKSRPFIFSTACSPLNAATILATLSCLQNDKSLVRKLQENIKTMRTALQNENLPVLPSETPIFPIMIGSAELSVQLSNKLYEQGILINAIRPPTVEYGKSRLRLTVTATHTTTELLTTAAIIGETFRKLQSR